MKSKFLVLGTLFLVSKISADPEPLKYLDLCGKPVPEVIAEKSKSPEAALTLAAYDILRKNCASCHNTDNKKGAKSFGEILNVEELVANGILDLKAPEQSLLLQQIAEDSMPLNAAPLSKTDKEVIRNWIASGSPSFSPSSSYLPEVGFISVDDMGQCMVKDLSTIAERERPFIRYLTLANLYNSGRRTELQRARLAVNKLLNSLSWKRSIENPSAVDGTSTLLRIDLRHYGWSKETWDEIGKRNPYHLALHESSRDLRNVGDLVESNFPHLRGDWFVFEVSRPPLYDKILFESASPIKDFDPEKAVLSLERFLRVNTSESRAQHEVVSAGFRQSNVTKSNRIVRRFDTPYGAYWFSEDFNGRSDRQNIFDFPNDADFDGGEYIFSLPNGLHGYLVTSKSGKRLDSVPLTIAVDPLRLHADGAVINGASCMSCHNKGIKRRRDEIGEFYSKQEKFYFGKTISPDLELKIQLVKDEYPGNQLLDEAFSQDEKQYSEALFKTGNTIESPDPVYSTTAQYEAPLSLRDMAAELERSTADLTDSFEGGGVLVRRLGLDAKYALTREQFVSNSRELSDLVGRQGGRYLVSDTAIDPQFEFSVIDGGTFVAGAGTESTWKSSINYQYEIQTTELSQRIWNRVMKTNPSQNKGDDLPVDTVSWDGAIEFIFEFNRLPEVASSKYEYRLPSEQEWEFAARGAHYPDANMEAAWFFGVEPIHLSSFAWFASNSGQTTHPVRDGSKRPNPAGLYDIYGNVWEWTSTELYEGGVQSVKRVLRGGSYLEGQNSASSNAKRFLQKFVASANTGFRLVRRTKDGSSVNRNKPVVIPVEGESAPQGEPAAPLRRGYSGY